MPQNGATAIQAGLVRESDPAWTYSDDHRASNGFTLTDLGSEIMVEQKNTSVSAPAASRSRPAPP